jgi:hypothetical protein
MSIALEVFISVNGFEQLHQLALKDEGAETCFIMKHGLHSRFCKDFRASILFDVPN